MTDSPLLPAGSPPATGQPIAPAPALEPVGHRVPGRARWLIAAIATGVIVLAVAAFLVLAGRGSSVGSAAPAYLPADTLVYVDARLDLPGDQRQQLATFLSKFPGFADPSTLPAKLDDFLTRLLRSASGGKLDYATQVQPWFGGQVAVALTALPASAGASKQPDLLVAFNVTSEQTAQSEVASIVRSAGLTVSSTETYRGVAIETLARPASSRTIAVAVTSEMVLVAPDAGQLKEALDVKAGQGSSLALNGAFTGALAKLRADRLGTVYVDEPALLAAVQHLAASLPNATALPKVPNLVGPVAGELHAAGNSLVATFRGARGPDAPAQTARSSELAGHVPADAVVYVEAHDAGALIGQAIGQLEQLPQLQGSSAQLQALNGLLGSDIKDYLSWVQDLGFSVSLANGTPQGGLVATVGDQGLAQARVGQLVGLLKLAGAQAGGSISVTDQPHDGTTITTIGVDLANLGGAGAQRLDISLALKGNVFVLGLGDTFVKRVLDLQPSASLAQSPRYAAALAAAGGPQDTSVVWVDLAALRRPLANLVPAGSRATFDRDVAPFIAPFDHLIVVNTVEAGDLVGTMQLVTR